MDINENILKSLDRNKPSPVLFEESKSSYVFEFIIKYMKSICCDKVSNLYCDKCLVCKKINSNNYFDSYIFNTYLENLSKDKVSDIINNFSYSSLEKYGFKFLIIYGVENINKQVANMLLKSIEEPSKNTFYIFTTRNSNNVISTIRSRCFLYKIKSDYVRFRNELSNDKLNINYLDFFSNNFYSLSEVNEFKNSENFSNLIDLYNLFLTNKLDLKSVYKGLQKFKKLSYYELKKLILMIEPHVKEIDKKEKIYFLVNRLNYNINKTLVYNEILSII